MISLFLWLNLSRKKTSMFFLRLIAFVVLFNASNAYAELDPKKTLLTHPSIELTFDESQYLKNKGVINFCVDTDWMPFEAIQNGRLDGMTSDFQKLFSERLGIPFKLLVTSNWGQSQSWAKNGQCDVLPLVSITDERKEYLTFTKSYLTHSIGIITNNDVSFITSLSDLSEFPVGIVKGYSTWVYAVRHFPNNKFVSVDGIEDGLLQTSSGRISAFLVSVPVATHNIKKLGLTNLKVAGHIDIKKELHMGVSKKVPRLAPIITKLIESLDKADVGYIYDKWVVLRFDYRPNYLFYWKEVLALFIIIIVMLLWNRKLYQLNREIMRRDIELEQLASHDPLTNIFNRRAFFEKAIRKLQSAIRYDRDTTLMLIDLDNFKNINDTYGHTAGDEVLVATAVCGQMVCRETDLCARYGGEEFIFLLEETNEENAIIIAERLRRSISNIQIPGTEIAISASLGISSLKEDTETLNDLIKRADKALYSAKHAGRNLCKVG